METVFEKLYTPYGLRTLEAGDREFHPFYGGPMEERDMAYHQGTVWVFPLGAYYLAYLKVHDYSEEAKQTVKEQLETLEPASFRRSMTEKIRFRRRAASPRPGAWERFCGCMTRWRITVRSRYDSTGDLASQSGL